MSVILTKGDRVDLVKEAGGTLNKITVACGWDVRRGAGQDYDLDASTLGVGADNKALGQDWFVYYRRLKSPGDVIVHSGDNLTGAGDGDDEQIHIDLTRLPAEVHKIVVAVTIYQARQRGNQSFSQVENAFVRIVNQDGGVELARVDLSEDTESGVNCLVFCELYRHGDTWKLRSVCDGFTEELGGLLNSYGLSSS